MMTMLYEVLKTAKMGAGKAPDLYTALLAKNLRRDGEVKTLSGIPPLTFLSNGQPLLDLLISGNEEHSGTPTPDNPVMPQGTGERTGNLLDYKYLFSADYVKQSTYFKYYRLTLSPNTQYTLKTNAPVESGTVTFFFGNSDTMATNTDGVGYDTPKTVTSNPDGSVYIAIRYATGASTPIDIVEESDFANGTYRIMLNTGSTTLPFEPFGIKIPISSNSTTTPVYLGEVETTRRVKKYEFTGNETFSVSSTDGKTRIGYAGFVNEITAASSTLCSHYKYKYASNIFPDVDCFMFSSDKYMWIGVVYRTTVSDFKSYLTQQYAAGTPVTAWYVLAEPTTGIINEPLMKIGEYADTVSYEQAGVEIPTARGTNTLDVLTDVKPSEVYIKYKE